ncbi:MAG TPA: hypothetical protein VGX51_04945 [Solirubrobacteraceae bacterium]|jgi:hypothetical protein|nr:hypothetical protein [Solirubrobacteraceae bacterium]
MTTKQAFTPTEWDQVLEAPPSASLLVVTAQRGGTFRETIAIGKFYAEARQRHGESELLDEIVAAKPEVDHTRYHSPDELKEHALAHVRDAVALLDAKATAEEQAAYKQFVIGLAERVASAHREHGDAADNVSDAERAAIDSIRSALGSDTPPA